MARRHKVWIRATGAQEIRLHQQNRGVDGPEWVWLGTSLTGQLKRETFANLGGRTADPATVKVSLWWKASETTSGEVKTETHEWVVGSDTGWVTFKSPRTLAEEAGAAAGGQAKTPDATPMLDAILEKVVSTGGSTTSGSGTASGSGAASGADFPINAAAWFGPGGLGPLNSPRRLLLWNAVIHPLNEASKAYAGGRSNAPVVTGRTSWLSADAGQAKTFWKAAEQLAKTLTGRLGRTWPGPMNTFLKAKARIMKIQGGLAVRTRPSVWTPFPGVPGAPVPTLPPADLIPIDFPGAPVQAVVLTAVGEVVLPAMDRVAPGWAAHHDGPEIANYIANLLAPGGARSYMKGDATTTLRAALSAAPLKSEVELAYREPLVRNVVPALFDAGYFTDSPIIPAAFTISPESGESLAAATTEMAEALLTQVPEPEFLAIEAEPGTPEFRALEVDPAAGAPGGASTWPRRLVVGGTVAGAAGAVWYWWRHRET